MGRDDAAGRIRFARNPAVAGQGGGQYLFSLSDMRIRAAAALCHRFALARLFVHSFNRRCFLYHWIGQEPVVPDAMVALGSGDFDHRHSGGGSRFRRRHDCGASHWIKPTCPFGYVR